MRRGLPSLSLQPRCGGIALDQFAGSSGAYRERGWPVRTSLPRRKQKPGEAIVNSILVSSIVFAVIMMGVMLGALLRNSLPGHHLADDSKDAIRLGTGLVGTIAALVLGLLIASAKNSFDTQSSRVTQTTTLIVLLDQILVQYGPETREMRGLLRTAIGPLVDRIWRENSSEAANKAPFSASAGAEAAFAKILALSPQNDVQRALKDRAVQISTDLAQTRLSLFEQADNSIPMPFLVVLIFWLTIIFAGFSLFSRLNPTVIAALVVFALSASGAIFLILELSQPFSGLMQISSTPLRNALAPLSP
jgi:hypothetical protein